MNDKPGIVLDIPGFRRVRVTRVISDYTGTHSFAGQLSGGVIQRFRTLIELVEIDILTSDSFGTAVAQLAQIPLAPRILNAADGPADQQKKAIAQAFDLRAVAAFGNGRNDRLLLKAVKDSGGLAVAVDNGEGCAIEAILNADLLITGAENALDLLLNPVRAVATLRT